MLHPYPPADSEEHKGGISKSLLIDFDLSGRPDEDRYPPGYSKNVKDNCFDRSGVAGQTMQKYDDWKDLGSVMAHYSISLNADIEIIHLKQVQQAWESLWKKINQEGTPPAVALLENFIVERGDFEIKINAGAKRNMEQIAAKGTGSPNKLMQKPRGSLSVDQSGNK